MERFGILWLLPLTFTVSLLINYSEWYNVAMVFGVFVLIQNIWSSWILSLGKYKANILFMLLSISFAMVVAILFVTPNFITAIAAISFFVYSIRSMKVSK